MKVLLQKFFCNRPVTKIRLELKYLKQLHLDLDLIFNFPESSVDRPTELHSRVRISIRQVLEGQENIRERPGYQSGMCFI